MAREKSFLAKARALPRSDLLRLAYHEAGHAVAARLLGIEVVYVTIKPHEGGLYAYDTYGQCRVEHNGLSDLNAAIIGVAADIAVELHLGLPEDEHGDVVGMVGAAIYAQGRVRARELLETPAARRELRLLAEKLLREQTVINWDEEDNDG